MTTETPNAYLVVSSVESANTDGSTTVSVYHIGPFADNASAVAHAAEHNGSPHTVAAVQELINPANC